MYRLQFHNSPQRVLYMFKETGDDWIDITGSGEAVKLRFDEVSPNGVFTTIIKTSLVVTLIRTNLEDFQDIIESDDNEWTAVVVENGELLFENEVGYYYLSEGATLIFKGLLTLETYGEEYRKFANVNLTFHDRLGHLSELDFTAVTPKMRLTEILGQLLQPVSCSKYLWIEFPFDVEQTSMDGIAGYWANLRSPRNLLFDISEYHLQPKQNLLEDTGYFAGWRIYCDFQPNVLEETTPKLEDCGVIRMELVINTKNALASYLKFTLEAYIADSNIEEIFYRYTESEDSSEYEQTPTEEARALILMDTPNYPILDQSGRWQLVRRAKEIIANNEFNLRDNLLFPDTLEEEDFVYTDGGYPGFNLQYDFWNHITAETSEELLSKILLNFEIPIALDKAYANLIGSSGKIGVLVRGEYYTNTQGCATNTALIIKDSTTDFKVDIEVWATAVSSFLTQANFYTNIFALYEGVLYTYQEPPNGGGWVNAEDGILGLRLVAGVEEFTTGSFSNIPQPPMIPDGETYQICMFVDAGNPHLEPGQVTYITALSIVLQANDAYPKKLKLVTDLSETRRSPVELNPKFYNLPDVKGASGMYDNGIYGVGLDMEVDSVLIPAISGIVPLIGMVFNGNNGTMLAHLSDMYGIQHLNDRWEFDVSIKKQLTGNKYTLMITTEGEGSVTKDPDKTSYDEFEQVTLTATATDSQGNVVKWVVNGTEIPVDESGTEATLTLTMDEDKDVRAVFGGVVFYEEFENWEGSYPAENPVDWLIEVLPSGTVDTNIHVKPYGSIIGIHFYRNNLVKGLRATRLLSSAEGGSGKLQIDMPITEASGISIDAFTIQLYSNGVLKYSKNYVGTYNQVYEVDMDEDFLDEVRLILSTPGVATTSNVKIPYLKITKIG